MVFPGRFAPCLVKRGPQRRAALTLRIRIAREWNLAKCDEMEVASNIREVYIGTPRIEPRAINADGIGDQGRRAPQYDYFF